MVKVLIIEDNQKTLDYLKDGLEENYFIVDTAVDGEEGLYKAVENSFDVIILDIMMPKLNGWSVITAIRQRNTKTLILLLTAKDHVNDRVKGFELGADDYLVKPFAFAELLARIRALLRRKQTPISEVLQFADLRIELGKHKVYRNNALLNLSPKEFMLLEFFAGRPGEVLSRTLIAEQVWDIHFDTDSNAVDVAIKRLRDKIDSKSHIKLIHTVRGVGYVFEERGKEKTDFISA